MNSTQEIHGHEVIQMIAESGRSFTRTSLKETILGKFGAEARFFTCSANNMTADDLITFLGHKGILAPEGENLQFSSAHVCSH